MGQNTVRTLRVLELMKDTDEAHPLTASMIAEKLEDLYGIRAERKAIGRDIEDLNYCGWKIAQHEDNRRGWYMEHTFDDWELKILMDAAQSAKFLDQKSTDILSEKLRSLAGADSRRTLGLMAVPADSKRGDRATRYVIDNVLRAMRSHSKVQFEYVYTDEHKRVRPKHPDGTKPVSPYALIWRKDKYYLIGSYNGESLSYYRMDRIRRLNITEERAVPLQDILGSNAEQKLKSFIKKNIYNKKGEEIRLRLRLTANGMDTVLDSFGEDVRAIPNEDGTIEAFVTVADSEGLYTWLMHHAGECFVIEPQTVREEMKKRMKDMLENYSEPEEKRLDVLALEFASRYHAGQFNEEDPTEPVICHPIAVAKLVEGEKEKAVAYLHDVLEDTEATEEEMRRVFGDEITDAVVADTRREGEDYWDYLERVKKNPLALKVKLADLQHNLARETDRTSKRYEKHKRAYEELAGLITCIYFEK